MPVYLMYKGIFESNQIRWFIIFNDFLFCVFLCVISFDFIDNVIVMSDEVKTYCVYIIIIATFSGIAFALVDTGKIIYLKIKARHRKTVVMPTNETNVYSIVFFLQ